MAGAPFLFGKLPAHGDFVARGLSDADRDRWDTWSTFALDALRSRTGEEFEEAHGSAPPWRFVVSTDAGGSGDRWIAGALAPSMDGAGRRYLLAIGVDGLSAVEAGAAGLQLAAEAETLIYEGLEQGFSADSLIGLARDRFADHDAATAAAARTLAARPSGSGVWWTLGSPTCAAMALAAGEAPHDLFARTVTPSLEPAV